MLNMIKNFKNDESGAVTVDWVILTAALVVLAIGAFQLVGDQIGQLNQATVADISCFEGALGTWDPNNNVAMVDC